MFLFLGFVHLVLYKKNYVASSFDKRLCKAFWIHVKLLA